MKTTKKLLALLLAGVMLVSMAACGAGDNDDDDSGDGNKTNNTKKENNTDISDKDEYKYTLDQLDQYGRQISVGFGYSAAVKKDGTVLASAGYGYNMNGELDEVANWTDIVAVEAAMGGIAAVKADGSVLLAGFTYEAYATWDLSEFTNIVDLEMEIAGDTLYGLKNDGTVVATGEEAYRVSGWSDVVELSVGGDSEDTVVGLKSDGTVLVSSYKTDMDAVKQWTDIISVSAGRFHVVGLKKDGTVVVVNCRPSDMDGHGEDNVSDWNNIAEVYAGNMTTIGLKKDGTVVIVGFNESDLSVWNNVIAIANGNTGIVALKSDGSFVTEGSAQSSGFASMREWNLFAE